LALGDRVVAPYLIEELAEMTSPMRSTVTLALVAAVFFTVGRSNATAQDLLIHGGTVVTSEGSFAADVWVQGGIIVAVGRSLDVPDGVRRIDASGRLVLPGGIDPHVHLGGSRADDYRTGSMAALAGGITTISNFAFASGDLTLVDAVDREAALIAEQALADVILHPNINDPSTQAAQIPSLLAETGQASIKVFMVTSAFDEQVRGYMSTMAAAGEAGILTMVHTEDGPILARAVEELTAQGKTSLEYFPDSRPILGEVVAMQRAVAMAEQTGAPIYAVHVSSERALRVAQDAQARGLPVYVETRPIYLHFTRDRFDREDRGLYVGQPPLRGQNDQDALWAGLANGTIQVLGTDHVAYTRETKLDPAQTISRHRAGLNNLQVVRPMLYSEGVVQGRITAERFVAVTSTNAAKLFGLYPQKGAIQVGSDADIVLWNASDTREIRDEDMFSGAAFSVYSGWTVTGWPTMTIRRGEIVFENGEILAEPGSGRLLSQRRWQGF
jgi:dihydropyrimidinase